MTPNGCWYHIQYVDLIDVDIKTGKYMVAPLSDEELAKIYKSGHSLDVSGYYDFDYTDCVDAKRKPIELKWGW